MIAKPIRAGHAPTPPSAAIHGGGGAAAAAAAAVNGARPAASAESMS